MVISQTPIRISLSGGGSDFIDYYSVNEGFVVSTAIDKYVFVIVKERFDDLIYVNYTKKEIIHSIDEIQHELFPTQLFQEYVYTHYNLKEGGKFYNDFRITTLG